MPSQDKWDCIKQLSAVAQVNVRKEEKWVDRQTNELNWEHLFKPSGKNHMHGLIFELKERMNSRQDQPVKETKQSLVKETERNLQKSNTLSEWYTKRGITQREVHDEKTEEEKKNGKRVRSVCNRHFISW